MFVLLCTDWGWGISSTKDDKYYISYTYSPNMVHVITRERERTERDRERERTERETEKLY